jgi:PhzF family phenazine biosynthesis protein
VAAAFSLRADDLHADLLIQALSTGLRYLVVPVRGAALGRARIEHDITSLVRVFHADYAVLIDPLGLEQRHWNNDGKLEDFATGSAASVVAAYLAQQSVIAPGEVVTLRQGRFAGRDSALRVRVDGIDAPHNHVHVGGLVVPIGTGVLRVVPA